MNSQRAKSISTREGRAAAAQWLNRLRVALATHEARQHTPSAADETEAAFVVASPSSLPSKGAPVAETTAVRGGDELRSKTVVPPAPAVTALPALAPGKVNQSTPHVGEAQTVCDPPLLYSPAADAARIKPAAITRVSDRDAEGASDTSNQRHSDPPAMAQGSSQPSKGPEHYNEKNQKNTASGTIKTPVAPAVTTTTEKAARPTSPLKEAGTKFSLPVLVPTDSRLTNSTRREPSPPVVLATFPPIGKSKQAAVQPEKKNVPAVTGPSKPVAEASTGARWTLDDPNSLHKNAH